jgi:murein DD-endopeptidase MepM/ murein hydrolase activator NlpD
MENVWRSTLKAQGESPMSDNPVSHAFVLPDDNFQAWLQALRPYLDKFERVAVVRSPRGNDLNRYRNVTAVTAPLTWFQDDPHAHIRRIYPMVVRVDVIRASTPQQMSQVLARRIANNDRYGQQDNNPVHLYDRFILEYPLRYRPMRIVRPFDSAPQPNREGFAVHFEARTGTEVIASANGQITAVWMGDNDDALKLGRYVQISTQHEGETYVVTYAGLRDIALPRGAKVTAGEVIGTTAGNVLMLMVQNQQRGVPHFRIPNVVDPMRMIYVQGLRVRPTDKGLRVRTLPSTDGEIMGQINTWDNVETLELHGRTLAKVGTDGEWLRVKLPDGRDGYTAAWFLTALTKGESGWTGVNPVGVNLDARHPLGTPSPDRLGKMGWVRLGYNVSNNAGSEDISAAFNRYAPLAEQYQQAGYKVIFATSHQTYGEGKNDFWPWQDMTDEKWRLLADRKADMMARIAQQYAGRGLVDVWQIWNEQDAHIGAQASAPMSVGNYAYLLRKNIQAIKASDNDVTIITGGHTGGPGRGSDYARATLNAMRGVLPDGIAFHPYGRSPNPGVPYGIFGHIDESVQAYGALLPDKPLWITEWGVLDRGNDNPADIARYALDFISYLKGRYPGRIATMIWYAWAQTMHNGYGLVDAQSRPRPPLTEQFLES